MTITPYEHQSTDGDSRKTAVATAVLMSGVPAAAGAVLAKKPEITYITALAIIAALPMMVLMRLAAEAFRLPPDVAGAWFECNIDATVAVVGARPIHSEEAQNGPLPWRSFPLDWRFRQVR